MAVLSQTQLAKLWVQAGGNPAKAGEASAIAMAESRGNTDAEDHDSNGTTDLGPWQINTVHTQFNPQSLINNPLYNAKAAVIISNNGTDFGPWVTFQTGAYKKFLSGNVGSSRVTTAPGSLNASNAEQAAKLEAEGITTQSGGSLSSLFGSLGKTAEIVANPTRLGKILIGGVLLIIAIDRLSGIKATPSAKTVVKGAVAAAAT